MNTALWLATLALAQDPAAQPQPPKPPASSPAPAPAKPGDTTVSTVTVSGARAETETSIDRRSYSVANDLQGKTGAIADVLRNIPSVSVDVQGNVSLRGDSSVTVLVDGRPSAQFSKDNLAQALQSLPADQVERVEVITNPSAEFRADGTGGIINLVLKKAKGAGKTGSARLGASSTGLGALILSNGFNSDKLSVVDNLAFRHEEVKLGGDYQHTQLNPGTGAVVSESRDLLQGAVNANTMNGRVGLDYDLSAKSRLSTSLAGSWQKAQQDFDDQFALSSGGLTTSAFSRRSEQDIEGKNVQAELSLRQKYGDGHELNLRAGYGLNEGLTERTDITMPSTPAGPATGLYVLRNNFNRRSNLSADYQKPLGEDVQLKAGYLFEYIDNLIQHGGGTGVGAGPVAPSPALTDYFDDVETHNQAYVTLQKKFGKLTALGGVRMETVHLDLDRRTAGLSYEQDYSRVYPSLHLGYDLGEGKRMTASYSKRVQRPIPYDLDPYLGLQNPYSAFRGNPTLTPQDTDSYELGYETRKGAAFTLATLYYRQTNNAFTVITSDLGNGVLLQQRENAGRQWTGGAELTMGNRLNKKLTYNASLNAYYTEISAPTGLGTTSENSSFTGFGRVNLNWQATPKDFVQLNVFANGKQVLPQGYVTPTVSGNIGYRHTINNKLSWMLVVQDPFNSLKSKLVFDTPSSRDVRYQTQNSRMATLTLVWNFAGKPRPEQGFDFSGGNGPSSGP